MLAPVKPRSFKIEFLMIEFERLQSKVIPFLYSILSANLFRFVNSTKGLHSPISSHCSFKIASNGYLD